MKDINETTVLNLDTNTRQVSRGKNYTLALAIQLLLVISLILGISLSSLLFYVIRHIEPLAGYHMVDLVNVESDHQEIVIKQNVRAERLVAQDEIYLNSILADRIELAVTKNLEGEKRQQQQQLQQQSAGIHMDYDTILMYAHSFGPTLTGEAFSMKLARSVNNIEVPAGIKNIRYIRSPDGLDVAASGELELSGNMGLRVHSQSLDIGGEQGCEIRSREGSINIVAEQGLLLPATKHIDESRWLQQEDQAGSNQNLISALCLDRDVGEIFQAPDAC